MENTSQLEVLNAKVSQLEFELKLQKERYQVLKEMTNCGLWEYDIASGTLYQSRKLDGPYEENNLIIPDYRNKMKMWGLVHLEDAGIFEAYCDSMDHGDPEFKYELRVMADKEEYIWILYEGATVCDESGKPIKVIGITRDITKEKQSQEALVQLAQMDSLTGLLNKVTTQQVIDSCFEKDKKRSTEMNAIYIMDIDDFKSVNDLYGHLYGDYVIKEVAKTIQECFDKEDVIGRIGGDEFIIMKKSIINKKEIEVYANQLLEATSALRLSKGNKLTISIGVSIYPKDDLTFEALYHKADMALYRAKELGKNTYHLYGPLEEYDQSLTITGRPGGRDFPKQDSVESKEKLSRSTTTVGADSGEELSAYGMSQLKQLEAEIVYINEVMNQQGLRYCGVDPETYEVLLTGNRKNGETIALEKGKICYECYGLTEPCEHCPVAAMESSESTHTLEYYDAKENGWISTTATKIAMSDNRSICVVGIQEINQFLRHADAFDSLTGLMTLEKFQKESMYLQATEINDRGRVIASISLKNYERIHNEFGYAVGTVILKTMGERIASCLTEGEHGCRFRRDEYVLYLYGDSKEIMEERLANTLRSVEISIDALCPEANAYSACGFYKLNSKEETVAEGIDRAVMVRDQILKGSQSMTNEVRCFDEHMEYDYKLRREIKNTMLDALINQEFKIYFQPKVTVDDIQIKGAEVLSRWIKPDGRQIAPAQYIPIFSETGFLLELDVYTYTAVFKQIRKWLDEEIQLPTISVNLSKIHIDDETFIEKFISLAKRYEIPAGTVELELPENLFAENLDKVLGVIELLKAEGFVISIDNFGFGYSSLNLIKILPIDVLKLDKNFFKQKILRETDKTTISNILHLAKGLGFKTVCEGVETREQVEFIDRCGNDMVQGYYYYKPMPIEEFEELIRK